MAAPQLPGAITVPQEQRGAGEQILLSLIASLPGLAFQGYDVYQQRQQRTAEQDAALALLSAQADTSEIAGNFQGQVGQGGPTGQQRRMAPALAGQLTTESTLATGEQSRAESVLGMERTQQLMAHEEAAERFNETMRPLQETLTGLQIDAQEALNALRGAELADLQGRAAQRLGEAQAAGVGFAAEVLQTRENMAYQVASTFADPTGADFPAKLETSRRLLLGNLDAASLGEQYTQIALGGGDVGTLTGQLAIDPVSSMVFALDIDPALADRIDEQVQEDVPLTQIWRATIAEMQDAMQRGVIDEAAAAEELARLVPLFTAYSARTADGGRPARFAVPEALAPTTNSAFDRLIQKAMSAQGPPTGDILQMLSGQSGTVLRQDLFPPGL